MKVLSALLAVVAVGCLDDEPVTVDDVMPTLRTLTADDARIADGRTPVEIEVCRSPDPGISASLNATLKTSAGAWQIADSDAKTTTVPMSLPCETRLLVPTTEAGTITVTGTIATFTRTLPLTLRMAAVEQVRLARQGALSSTASSMLTITANLDVAGGGKPSVGTLVTFDVVVDAPAGGSAYVSERQVRITQGTSVQTTLFVAQGVTSLTVTATASPDDQLVTASAPLVIAL